MTEVNNVRNIANSKHCDSADDVQPVMNRLKNISIPVLDISDQREKQVMVAAGTETEWQGHSSTLLLPDGKTMFCVWQGRRDGSSEHGAPVGFLKKSNDAGKTWSDYIKVPDNWLEIAYGAPTLHRLLDGNHIARIFVFCRDAERNTFLHALSEDDGQTWSPMMPLAVTDPNDKPITGWTAPITILESIDVKGMRKHLMWYEMSRQGKAEPGVIWQSASYDVGLTWGDSEPVVDMEGACEPAVIRSPDGKQLLMLIRENNRKLNSLFSVSNDEGASWSKPEELPLSLTGDRHFGRYTQDGRLVIVFRPVPPWAHKPVGLRGFACIEDSHFTAWVGRYEDIAAKGEGQYLIRLLKSYSGADHSYPSLERLPDGTFVGITYIKYRPGKERHSVMSIRFNIDDIDAQLSC